MKEIKEHLPVTMDPGIANIRSANWGEMTSAFNRMGEGVDFTPLLEGLPDDHCQCPHWGYVLKGRIRVSYTDGTGETVEDVVVCGDLGVEVATFEQTLQRESGEVITNSGRSLKSWRRQPDGAWKIVRNLGNNDPPPQPDERLSSRRLLLLASLRRRQFGCGIIALLPY